MGYAVIPLVASILLLPHHLFLTDASRASKLAVTIAVASSLVIWHYFPRWTLLATLIQVGAGVYMLLYLKLQESDGR